MYEFHLPMNSEEVKHAFNVYGSANAIAETIRDLALSTVLDTDTLESLRNGSALVQIENDWYLTIRWDDDEMWVLRSQLRGIHLQDFLRFLLKHLLWC